MRSTLHKYFGINEKHQLIFAKQIPQWIIVDELSLVTNALAAVLVNIKREYPQVKIVLSGDFRQCKSVDRVCYSPDVKRKSEAYGVLTDHNKLRLMVYHRGDKKMQKALESIAKHKHIDIPWVKHNFEKYPLHICKTHVTRMKINNYMMKHQNFIHNRNTCKLLIPNESSNWKAQDALLTKGTPVLARIKHNGFYKNERYSIKKFTKKSFWVNDVKYPVTEFHKYFTVAFAVTIDSIQCETITGQFCIWEYDDVMDWHDRYTSYGRGTSVENIFKAKSKDITDTTLKNLEVRRHVIRNIKKRKGFQLAYLGCTWNALLDKFSKQLEKAGLAFVDYGITWEVDHRQPEKEFDTSIADQCAVLHHCDNLDAISLEENKRKGGRFQ